MAGQLVFCETIKNDKLVIHLLGKWDINSSSTVFPSPNSLLKKSQNLTTISFNTSKLTSWDTSLIAFIYTVINFAQTNSLSCDTKSLPEDIQSILELAFAVQKKENPQTPRYNFLARIGLYSTDFLKDIINTLNFIGNTTITFGRILTGKNRFRFSETLSIIQQCGPEALPIVTLISVLIGLILAYIGAVQLQMFGATIYVANLVGIAMLREMGAIMAAIVMAGRTGAAFAAQLGTMQVNEEIDAFKTLGIPPIEMLVLPRMIALIIMMPLLCLYADILGIIGGAIVSIYSLNLDPVLFFKQVQDSIQLNDLFVGLIKSVVFGVLIAAAGCMKGIQCKRSASAVGEAVTGAVVSSIVAIVATDAIFAVITNILGV